MTGEKKYYRIPFTKKSALGWKFYIYKRNGKFYKAGFQNTNMSLADAFARLESKRIRREE